MNDATAKKPRAPKCACCGRSLPKFDVKESGTHKGFARSNTWKARKLVGVEPIHVVLEDKDLADFTADGLAPTRGPYGCNLVCSQVCGHVLAVRLVAALGIDVLSLLPEQWRPRA